MATNRTTRATEALPENPQAHSDGSLLRDYLHGNQDAARALYQRYARRLRGLARAQIAPDLQPWIDVEDLIQSVFGSFFHRASRDGYDVPAGEELWKLFLVIALNKIRNQAAFHHAAKRDVRRTATVDRPEETLTEAEDSAHRAFLELAREEALALLSPLQQQVVRLRLQGHEVAAIARQTRRSKRTVERSLQEACARLRHALLEEE
jgi:RNA polymerase sigma-70 factor (ECF subfamily)